MKKIILSDNKLNLLVDDVTNALLRQKPTPTGTIAGSAITNYCAHNQVNQFALFRVYQDASGYLAQLNHAYFDFGAAEVKEDLRRLLATLSRNIVVREGDFKTLLRAAVYNTLRLILNPEDTLLGFFFGNSDSIPIEVYRRNAVYFNDFDFIVRSILSWYEKNDLNRVEKAVFQEKMGRVVELFERKEGRSIGDYQRGLFKSLTGKDLDAVMGMAAATIEEREQPSTEAPKTQVPVAEEQKKPLISVRPREREQSAPATPEVPASREVKSTVPPWVEQKNPPPVEEEEKPTVFSRSSAPPRSETPPWVEKKNPTGRQEPVILDPVTPLPEEENKPVAEQPKVETPRVETPKVEAPKIETPAFDMPPRVETPKVEPPRVETPRVETPRVETPATEERKPVTPTPDQKEEKRSLNDIFANKEKERSTLLDRNKEQQEKAATVDNTVKSIMDRLAQEKEQKSAAESPRTETPKVETPRVETPRVETPRVETPAVEQPKVETPRVETPRVETPRVETPRAETPAERPFIVPPSQGEGKTTIADRFKENSGTLADSLAAKNIRTEQIPVHKQFQFVQKVFGGSSVKFKVILDKINKTTTAAEADDVLEKYVFNDPNVNRNDKVAKEFEQLVRARFE